jgi:hypothetical protein
MIARMISVLLPESTLAQEPTRLVIVAKSADVLSERLAAELSALGFVVNIVAPQSGHDPALEFLKSMRRESAAAALWLPATESGPGALIFAREEGPIETLRFQRAPGVSDAMWAIQLVERLRPALFGLPSPAPAATRPAAVPDTMPATDTAQPAQAPERAPPYPTAQPHAPVDEELSPAPKARAEREPSARFATELGLGMLGAYGMAPVSALSATLSMLVLPPALRVELLALVPLQRMEHETKAAKTLSHITLVGLDLRLDLLRGHTFQLSLALGAALSLLRTQSRTLGEPGTLDKTSGSACGYLSLGSAYQLTRVIALRGEAIVGSFIDPLLIFAGQDPPLNWGRPWFAGFFAVETRFP